MADKSKLNIINSSRILRTIWLSRGISRIEISEHLGLDRSTVTKIMNTLLEKEWVVKREIQNSREALGRKPVGLAVNVELGAILGIEIQTQNCRALVVDFDGSIILSRVVPFDPEKESILSILTKLIQSLEKELTDGGKTLLGVGVGISGVVDPGEGIIHLSNPLLVTGSFPLAAELTSLTGLPVFIENDANCCCWGEMVYRKEKEPLDFLTVLGEFRNTNITNHRRSGIAVGLGIVLRGEVYYGDDFTAGEFKSIDWKSGGITQFSISNEESRDLRENKGALEKVFKELVRNLALIVNVFNFKKIIFAGDFVYHPGPLEFLLKEAVNHNWLYNNLNKKDITVNFSPFEENAVAYGAAGHFLERIFSIPTLEGDDSLKNLRGTALLSKIIKS